jgi:anti-sigma regulatory factor (Ser/Thr protein kinase)
MGLKLQRRPMEITTYIKTPEGERRDCFFHMEYIITLGEPEIMIRVYIKEQSSLVKNFVSGWEEFRIPNTIEAAYEVCRFIGTRLTRYLPQNEADLITGGVREMVINAMEHGNLEISGDEKVKALEDENYYALLQTRAEMDEYRDRRITVRSSIDSTKAQFVIRDEGKGFDHAAVLKAAGPRTENPAGAENRNRDWGIALSTAAFDLIRYNETGNEVTLEKNLTLDQS